MIMLIQEGCEANLQWVIVRLRSDTLSGGDEEKHEIAKQGIGLVG
jgi:hypothetical protein